LSFTVLQNFSEANSRGRWLGLCRYAEYRQVLVPTPSSPGQLSCYILGLSGRVSLGLTAF